MNNTKVEKSYSLLKNWWDNIDLTSYEKNIFNKEIISFNHQLFRLREKQLRIAIYGRSGVGKSSILNLLLNKNKFKTGVINGTTREIEINELDLNHKILKSIELVDSPGFDVCDIKYSEDSISKINESEIILFVISGDLNRNEISKINLFIKNGKKIIVLLNKIDIWKENEIKNISKNIRSKLPKDINIPIILNSENNIKNYISQILNKFGEGLLLLNSLQLADKLFLKIKAQRLKKRQKEAQSIIGKFATIKASGVALNPIVFFDIAGSFALDTALISELSKVYGLSLKGESARKIIKKISVNNIFLGATQVAINSSFNLMRKIVLTTAPFTNGLSLLPYGPIAITQAAIAIHSTKILGKLAAKEIFKKSKISSIDLSQIIRSIMLREPEVFDYTKIYYYQRQLDNNVAGFLP